MVKPLATVLQNRKQKFCFAHHRKGSTNINTHRRQAGLWGQITYWLYLSSFLQVVGTESILASFSHWPLRPFTNITCQQSQARLAHYSHLLTKGTSRRVWRQLSQSTNTAIPHSEMMNTVQIALDPLQVLSYTDFSFTLAQKKKMLKTSLHGAGEVIIAPGHSPKCDTSCKRWYIDCQPEFPFLVVASLTLLEIVKPSRRKKHS